MSREIYSKAVIRFLFFIAFLLLIAPVSGFSQEPLLLGMGSLTKSGSSDTQYQSATYSIPAGKRLVIEQIFIEVRVPIGTKPRGTIRIDTGYSWGSNSQYLPFLFTSQGNYGDSETYYSSNQTMKLYVINPANSGYTKKVSFWVTVPIGAYAASTPYPQLSGYLEDAP